MLLENEEPLDMLSIQHEINIDMIHTLSSEQDTQHYIQHTTYIHKYCNVSKLTPGQVQEYLHSLIDLTMIESTPYFCKIQNYLCQGMMCYK